MLNIPQQNPAKIFHCILQEALCHSNFSYIKIHLDKYNDRAINSNASPGQPLFHSNIFDLYAYWLDDHDMSYLNFYQKYELKRGTLAVREKERLGSHIQKI